MPRSSLVSCRVSCLLVLQEKPVPSSPQQRKDAKAEHQVFCFVCTNERRNPVVQEESQEPAAELTTRIRRYEAGVTISNSRRPALMRQELRLSCINNASGTI